MKVLKYKEWADTAELLHMLVQMIGKVKLARMSSQPEWSQVVLYPSARGFTTGLIPIDGGGFDISVNLATSMVYAHHTNGAVAGFPLRNNTSISEYYGDFMDMLKTINAETSINTKPQEVANTTPFDQQHQKVDYDTEKASRYHNMCIFAHNALLDFASPFRGKKILPALFWGTFDVTTVLFSGEESEYPGKGIIEEVAFDEKFMEFGFWPGDASLDEPSFFILPYPFLEKDYSGELLTPSKAVYSAEKKEFFLSLEDAFSYQNPAEAINQFCCGAFDRICEDEGWAHIEWFRKPLLV